MEYAVKHKFIVIIDVIASVNASQPKDCVRFTVQIMVVTRALPTNMNFPSIATIATVTLFFFL